MSNYRGDNPETYERQAEEMAWHGHEILFGLMYEYIQSGESLLDIGIGTGLSSLLFHKAGLKISGFDSSPDMLEECRKKKFSGTLIRHDLLKAPYPFPGTSFDNIISLAVLNFFSDLSAVFREAARIIKANGIFAFSIEEKKEKQDDRYSIHIGEGTEQEYDVLMYRHGDAKIRDRLGKEGFTVLKEYEFLAARYPEQMIDIYFKLYINCWQKD